jgi:hypothetical protein
MRDDERRTMENARDLATQCAAGTEPGFRLDAADWMLQMVVLSRDSDAHSDTRVIGQAIASVG